MPRPGRIILLLLLLLWAYGAYRLGTLWQGDLDYRYGWFVPLLCAALLAERWKCRPQPGVPRRGLGKYILFGLAGFGLLAGALLLEVTPVWRLAGWIFTLSLVGLTLVALYLWGGGNWARHLGFPVVFLLVAVPWPSVFEKPLIYDLSHLNATLSAGLANGLGIPCLRQGTLIQTGSGMVGVEDACSGIRSLQATVMVSLFLGELFRYSLFRRVLMLVAGMGMAFAGNVARTLYLIRICDLHGTAAVNLAHDEAGFGILAGTLAGLLVLAWLLSLGSALVRPGGEPGKETSAGDNRPAVLPEKMVVAEPSGAGAIGALAALIVVIGLFELGMERWFAAGEKKVDQAAPWTFALPVNARAFVDVPVPEATRVILKYDEGQSAQWRDDQERPWQLFYFRWLPTGNRYRASEINIAARGHAPDVCLRNAGMVLQTNLGTEIIESKGVRIQATIERWLDNSRRLHVLAAYWEPTGDVFRSGPRRKPSTSLGWQLAMQEIKNHDRGRSEKRVIKIGVWDMTSDEEAEAALKNCLLEAISR